MPKERDFNDIAADSPSPPEGDSTPSPLSGRFARVGQMLRDAAAVLAAILIAFTLDAWWDGRVERASMLDALDAVSVELQRNIELLDEAVARDSAQVGRASEVLGLRHDDLATISDEDIRRYSDPGFVVLTLERGAITAFIQGEFLQAVDDVDLRTTVAAISTLQDELDEEREGLMAADERWTAVMFSVLGAVEPSRALLPDREARRGLLELFIDNDQLRGATMARAISLRIYTDELRRVGERLEEARDALGEAGK